MTKDKIVLPGDQVSTSEELLPGEGTFEEDGIIKAAIMGKYQVEEKTKKAIVKPLTSTPVLLKKGNIVLARVNMVKSSMVIADVIHVIGKVRPISGDTNGTLRVSEISHSYTKDPSYEFAPGDIIRAKVTQVKPNIQLSTKDKDLGSIRALCKKCRQPLIKKDGNKLECKKCGKIEKRTIAIDYGEYDINKL